MRLAGTHARCPGPPSEIGWLVPFPRDAPDGEFTPSEPSFRGENTRFHSGRAGSTSFPLSFVKPHS